MLHLTVKTKMLGHAPLDNHMLEPNAAAARQITATTRRVSASTAQLLEQLIGRFTVRS